MYESIYRKNKETGRYIIDIALGGYMEFFHEWDNASFKRRDMHPELAEFLEMSAEEIPVKEDLEIDFCVSCEERDEKAEKLIRQSYENYYNYFEKIKEKKIKGNFQSSLALAAIGIVLIFLNSLLTMDLPHEIWYEVPLKGLYIGGYVFFWEALYNGYFGSKELIDAKRKLKRLKRATLHFKYNEC